MKVAFFTPPAEQRVGGLDAAIDSLRAALTRRGLEVTEGIQSRPDRETVAHFHGLWQYGHTKVARKLREHAVPYIVSPHGMLEPWAWRHKLWKKWPYFHLVEKGHLRGSAALLATATSEANRLRQFVPGHRVETLPLGLTGDARPDYEAARQRLGWAPEERVLLFLSRIHPKKGLDLLLRALAGLPIAEPTRLVIVGNGEREYVAQLVRFAETQARKLPRIEWKGALWGDARWSYFQGADLFCLPTHSENFGLAVLEACQVGTPALTTRETPWATYLDGGRGYIGQPTVESMRDLLGRFLARNRTVPKARAALADWAWDTFHWDTLASSYEDFYRSVLPGARQNPAPEG